MQWEVNGIKWDLDGLSGIEYIESDLMVKIFKKCYSEPENLELLHGILLDFIGISEI